MTVLNVDGALVVFEGIHRLQWHNPDWFNESSTDGESVSDGRILSHIWPDRETGARIRRSIDQHQRVVVVLEERLPIITLARHRVRRIPDGAIELAGSDSTEYHLAIPPFTWLTEKHRRRGEEFTTNSGHIGTPPTGGALPDLLVEDSLIGTHEPVRFIHALAPLSFGVLRAAIDRLYRIDVPATHEVTELGVAHPNPCPVEIPAERRRAA